jgi:ubiquinone/menaquinone biosynthesis C-methylase UbiE
MGKEQVAAKYQDRGVVEVYDQQRYHGVVNRYKNWRMHRVVRRILQAVPPGTIVLDLPCGTGRMEDWLLRVPVRVLAADVSEAMLARTRDKVRPTGDWMGLLRTDACRLALKSRSVDDIFSIRFLHLLDEATRLEVLREFARVARRWVVVEYRRIESPAKGLQRAVLRLFGRVERPKWSLEQTATELATCGLAVERYHYVSRWFSSVVVVQARHQGP